MGGSHGHTLSAGSKNKKDLVIVLSFTTLYLVAEVVGGLLTGSLALLAISNAVRITKLEL